MVSCSLGFIDEQAIQMHTERNPVKKWPTSTCLLGTNNGQRGVHEHWDHAVTSPWTESCGTHLSAVVWQSRLLSLHLPWYNQQKLWLVGPPVTYTDKLQQPIRAQKECPDHVCGHSERCDLLFWHWGSDFLGQCEHSRVVEAHERGDRCCDPARESLTCSNFQPSDMVDTICVSSSSWHCSTRYTCFTGTWETCHFKKREKTRLQQHKNVAMQSDKLHTCDVLQSRSLILSLMSFINDVML